MASSYKANHKSSKTAHQGGRGKVKKDNPTAKVLKKQAKGVQNKKSKK